MLLSNFNIITVYKVNSLPYHQMHIFSNAKHPAGAQKKFLISNRAESISRQIDRNDNRIRVSVHVHTFTDGHTDTCIYIRVLCFHGLIYQGRFLLRCHKLQRQS